jgi:antitoxin VapB
MALNIKNPTAESLARELAEATGETITDAVIVALRERLDDVRRRRNLEHTLAAVRKIQERVAALPVRDPDFTAEMLYDEYGLPR